MSMLKTASETPLTTKWAPGVAMSLIEKGVNIRARVEDEGESILHAACGSGLTEVARALVERGVKVNNTDGRERTALHWASKSGFAETCAALIEMGAEVDHHGTHVETPLHMASGKGFEEVVRTLVERGADIHALDEEGVSPLQEACLKGKTDVVLFLLLKGVLSTPKTHLDVYLFIAHVTRVI